MPKEQAHFGERVPRGTSKNAKDKSNCATLRASLDATHRDQEGIMGMSGRLSRYDSEKDSGYSEAGSDSLQADLDDQRSSVSEPHRAHSSSSSSSSSSRSSTGHSMPTYEDQLSPVYVIKNMVVKPSVREQLLHSPVAWGGGWRDLSGAKTPTQLLLIPQLGVHTPTPAPAPTPSNPLEPQGQSKKGGSRSNKNHGSKNSYLPIFNSYPRIAPHPRKEGPELGRAGAGAGGVKESGSEGQSLSKRVCTEDKREAVSTTTRLKPQQQQREGRPHSYSHNNVSSSHSSSPQPPHRSLGGRASSTQQRSHCCHQKPNRSPSPSLSNGVGSPSVSSSQTPSPPSYSNSTSSSSASSSTAVSPHRVSPEALADGLSDSLSDCSSTRQRRFLNTTEILSQSGLLAITLRTKELLRQNAATERDLAQLRQHAQLLCLAAQAAQTGQENPQQGPNESPSPLDKLLQAMAQSGRYPSLDWAQLKAQGHHRAEKGDKAEKEKDNHGYNNNNNNNNNNDNNDNYDRPSQNPAPVSRGHRDDYTAPPSPLFAPSPAPEEADHGGSAFFNPHSAISGPRPASEQGGRQGINAKPMCDLIMPPDSSTHQYLL